MNHLGETLGLVASLCFSFWLHMSWRGCGCVPYEMLTLKKVGLNDKSNTHDRSWNAQYYLAQYHPLAEGKQEDKNFCRGCIGSPLPRHGWRCNSHTIKPLLKVRNYV